MTNLKFILVWRTDEFDGIEKRFTLFMEYIEKYDNYIVKVISA